MGNKIIMKAAVKIFQAHCKRGFHAVKLHCDKKMSPRLTNGESSSIRSQKQIIAKPKSMLRDRNAAIEQSRRGKGLPDVKLHENNYRGN